MSDLKIDTATGDLAIEAGDLVLLQAEEAIAQNLRVRLRMFQGEWFVDSRIGLPYFQQVLIKKPNLGAVRAIFADTILSIPGVLAITALTLDFNTPTRRLSVSFRAQISGSDVPLDFIDEFILPA